MEKLRIERTKTPKTKPEAEGIAFGTIFSDHMFLMNYEPVKGWHDARIVPYAPFVLDPACVVLHYAQEVFEGLKAYRTKDGIQLFRPWDNFKRLNSSCRRLSIPEIDADFALEALKTLVDLERDWVPDSPEASLYIRPFIFGTDEHLGVTTSSTYLFAIILSPVGSYYPQGMNPVNILIENEDVRAVKGGLGHVKSGGSYAASLRAGQKAHEAGCTQVLWLDGVERRYIEEVGAMNVFFVIGDEIVTPALQGSILPGITRDSCIQLLKKWGYQISERVLCVDELIDGLKTGIVKEAFGSGTAAVVSPIGKIRYLDKEYIINSMEIGGLSQKLYDELTGIQWGSAEDSFGWTVRI